MLQLKLYFPDLPKCIRGITDQYRLPMAAECFLIIDPPPQDLSAAGTGQKQKELAPANSF